MENIEANSVPKPSTKNQYLAVLVVNFLLFGYGIACGWVSPSLMILMSDESPLPTGKITVEEASWVASLVNLGGFLGTAFFGLITNKFGRKIPLIIITIPTLGSWLLVLYAQNVYYIYAARLFTGFIAASYFIIIPLFFSEISTDSVRGVLGSTILLTFNMGMLLAFILGNYCDFYVMPKIVVVLSALCGILLIFFPESPIVLVKQDKIAQAEKSLRFYRNMSGQDSWTQEHIQQEICKLKSAVGNQSGKSKKSSMSWSDLFSGPGRKAISIGIVLAVLSRFSGCMALLTYTANIFEEAGSNLSPNISTIIVGVLQLIGSYASTILVDRAGRKFLFIISGTGTALGLTTLGIYMMLRSWGCDSESFDCTQWAWVPVASVSFTIFIASWAVLTLPFLVIAEIMPENIKDFSVSFCTFLVWFISFFTTKFLPFMNEIFGFHGSMFIFAGVAMICVVFIILFMPETKGKSREEIMKLLE